VDLHRTSLHIWGVLMCKKLRMNIFSFFMKVQELEKEILDSREKTEFFRTKMQELVSTL
jgi:hypothetical protein